MARLTYYWYFYLKTSYVRKEGLKRKEKEVEKQNSVRYILNPINTTK